MFSYTPFEPKETNKENKVKEILRVALMAELDAINLYEQLAAATDREDVRKVFEDIANEEKVHVGEFQAMLLREDAPQIAALEKGKKEVGELLA